MGPLHAGFAARPTARRVLFGGEGKHRSEERIDLSICLDMPHLRLEMWLSEQSIGGECLEKGVDPGVMSISEIADWNGAQELTDCLIHPD
jgi:hypothetical protein